MKEQRNYEADAMFYEQAWKSCAQARNRDEVRLNMKARWLAEQLAKVEQALNPFGFTRSDPPRSADNWLYMADSAVEHIEMISKYAQEISQKDQPQERREFQYGDKVTAHNIISGEELYCIFIEDDPDEPQKYWKLLCFRENSSYSKVDWKLRPGWDEEYEEE